MKKTVIIISILLFTFMTIFCQEKIKENPANPTLAKDSKAVKDLSLTKQFEISDEQEGFFFKSPREIKIADNGDVFIQDNNHLYQFNSEGKFLRDLIIQGEGPGELKYFINFFLTGNTVTIGGIMPVKIIQKSITDGKLIKEFKVQKAKTMSELMHVIKDRFYFNYANIDFQKLKTGIQEKHNKFMFTDSEGSITEQNLSFMTKDAMIKITSGNSMSISMNTITQLLRSFDDKHNLYIANTERYLITKVDFLNQKILKKFRRKYQPVKYIKPKKKKSDNRVSPDSQYKRKHYNDIQLLRHYQNQLFVFTSTLDSKRGFLVDVYNENGEYSDCFYLNLPGVNREEDLTRRPITFHKGYLWTSYKDDDENPIVVKYKIKL